MNRVKIDRARLLARVQDNREKHRVEADDARRGYYEQLVEKAARIRREASMHLDDPGLPLKNFEINLIAPTSHLADYDTVIDMLDMSSEDVIEISQDEFRRYVRDEWPWKSMWSSNSQFYSNGSART